VTGRLFKPPIKGSSIHTVHSGHDIHIDLLLIIILAKENNLRVHCASNKILKAMGDEATGAKK
jgi:hypothetical protein